MKDKILDLLLSYYKKTKWNFVTLKFLQNRFGVQETRDALNELYKEGYIQKREGINSPIVELIKFEK